MFFQGEENQNKQKIISIKGVYPIAVRNPLGNTQPYPTGSALSDVINERYD